MGIMETLLVVAVVVVAAVILMTHKHGRTALAFLVGVSAGLVAFQVLRVHVFTVIVIIWVLYRGSLWNRKAPARIAVMAIPVALLAYTSLVGDLVNSNTLALQLAGLALSAALIIAFSSQADRQQMLYGLLAIVTISSTVGLLQVVKIVPIETWHAQVSTVGRPIGLYPEPDWLGMFAGVGAVIAWRADLGKHVRTLSIAVNAGAFVLAFARAAWIAVGVAVAVGVLLALLGQRRANRPKVKGRAGAIVLLAAAAAMVLVFVPVLVEDLTTRLGQTFQVQRGDISGQARVRQFDSLWHLADIAPFYGHGLSASGRVGVWGQIDTGAAASNNVASNWLLAMWVDGKYLAVPMVLLLALVTLRAVRTIHGQALLVVLLSSLFSNATFFPVTWLLLAMCLAEPNCARPAWTDSERPRENPSPHHASEPLSTISPSHAIERQGKMSERKTIVVP